MPDVSLVNLKSLSEVGLRLVKMIYDVYGAPLRIQNETKARITSLRRINESDLPDEQKQQIRFWLYVKADEQRNTVSVVEKTIPQLTDDAKPEDVEADWYRHFFNRQCSVSDSQMQEIWARILAGEVNQPGSFSRRTLSILSDLDKSEAEVFAKLCGFCWKVGGIETPLIVKRFHKNPIYSCHEITFSTLSHLQTIGLLQFDYQSPFLFPSDWSPIHYFGRQLELLDVTNEFRFSHAYFSVCGRELSGICDREPIDGLWEYVTHNHKEVFGSTVAAVSFF